MFYVSQPLTDLPDKFHNGLQRKVYQLITELSINFERVECDPAITMEQCLNVDRALNVRTIKTVVLTNRQKTSFYLYVMPADKPFVTRDFSSALGIARVSFAPEDLMVGLLGTNHGSATVLSAVADQQQRVRIIIDHEVAGYDNIACTDGDARGFLKLSVSDIVDKYLPATGHKAEIIMT